MRATTISIPFHWSVFVLDDTEDRISWFRSRLPGMRHAKTAEKAIEILAGERFEAVFLDHDLHWMDAGDITRQHGNGKEVARFLAIRKFAGKIVIHSRNHEAVPIMQKILPQATIAPFGEFEIVSTASAAQ